MGKKRDREAVSKEERDPDAMVDSSDDEDFDTVNVDFEWFNFDAEIDFHGTKTLFRQLLDVDSPLFDASALADLILSQPTIGSTVKVDGKENDAYALITALNLTAHREHAGLKTLRAYLAEKAGGAAALKGVRELLEEGVDTEEGRSSKGGDVGLVLSERLINMPAEVAGPLYTTLTDELEAAVEDGEPYTFAHYVVLSRVYREVTPDPELQAAQQPKSKKPREQAGGEGEVFYFHPEDEVLGRFAAAAGTFRYTKEGETAADSRRAFQEMGIRTEGLLMVIEGKRWAEAVAAVSKFLGGAS